MADAAESIAEIIRPFGDGKTAFRLAYATVSGWEKRRDRSLFAVYNRSRANKSAPAAVGRYQAMKAGGDYRND